MFGGNGTARKDWNQRDVLAKSLIINFRAERQRIMQY